MCVMPMNPRPTTATLTLRFEISGFGVLMKNLELQFAEKSSCRKFFNKLASRADVRHALIARFPLNAEVALKSNLIQSRKKRGPIHLAGARDNFLAPRAGDFGAPRILDVDLPNPRPKRA